MEDYGKTLRLDDLDMVMHHSYMYVGITPRWAEEEFGQDEKKKGDMISFGCRKLSEDNDDSKMAKSMVHRYHHLLKNGKRWPSSMRHKNDARCNLTYWLSHIRYKLGWASWRLYRTQRGMTRDPFVMVIHAAAKLGEWGIVYDISIPWYLLLNSPTTRAWHHYLKTGEGLAMYERLEARGSGNEDDFVKLLKHYRRKTVELKKAQR